MPSRRARRQHRRHAILSLLLVFDMGVLTAGIAAVFTAPHAPAPARSAGPVASTPVAPASVPVAPPDTTDAPPTTTSAGPSSGGSSTGGSPTGPAAGSAADS